MFCTRKHQGDVSGEREGSAREDRKQTEEEERVQRDNMRHGDRQIEI